jgi:hypothetical protein
MAAQLEQCLAQKSGRKRVGLWEQRMAEQREAQLEQCLAQKSGRKRVGLWEQRMAEQREVPLG